VSAAWHVRRLKPGETPLLRDLRVAALRDAPNAFGRTLADALAQPDTYWTDMAQSVTEPGRHVMFLAEEDDRPLGIVFGIRKAEGIADLGGMWVDPRARGRGAGRALAEAVLDWARSEGFATVVLWVTEGNVAAQTLYARLGFAPTGQRAPLPSNTALTIVEMRVDLASRAAR
jgi:GNAT superfamily N-acetyltransferase